MKKILLTLILLLSFCTLNAQMIGSVIFITKTWSPNHRYYLQSIPYTNIEPSLKGKAAVYDKNGKLIYTFARGFNGVSPDTYHIALSNDGNTLLYMLSIYSIENTAGLRSVSIYRKGQLIKDFTLLQFTGCNDQNERCELFYNNYDKVVDRKKSGFGSRQYHKVFKDDITDTDKFLNERFVQQDNDVVYTIDPQKRVHRIDLKKADTLKSQAFETYYAAFKNRPADTLTSSQKFEAPYPKTRSWFPNLINGDTTAVVLGKLIGYKPAYVQSPDFSTYRVYHINIEAYISRDGAIDIQKINVDKKLPADIITGFFKSHKYDVSFLPPGVDKWYFGSFFCAFRNPSDSVALVEKKQEQQEQIAERKRRMTLDTINGIYIPRNLEECFRILDTTLSPVNKNAMKALKSRSDMIRYHLGLGMWMRNTWGLWGGSRLVQYFKDHGAKGMFNHDPDPEGLSTVILFSYYDWLQGNKNVGKEWEEKNPLVKKP